MASQQKATADQRQEGARGFLGEQGELLRQGFSFSGYERDLVALNRGDGTFMEISGVSGADSVSDGRGAVYADFDNDGDLDIFLRAMHGPAHFLFENRVGQDAGFIRVALEGRASGRDAFGAVVRVGLADGRILARQKAGGSGFVSQSDPRLLFGLGGAERVEWLEVTWPGGGRQRYPAPASGSSILLVEGRAEPVRLVEAALPLPAPLDPDAALEADLTFGRGDLLPGFAVITPEGQPLSLSDLIPAGRRTLVNFWATWCGPCAEEMPALQRLASAGQLAVVGVSLDRLEDRGAIADFVERVGVTYPVAAAPPEALPALFRGGRVSIPLSVVVAPDGRVEALFSGWSRQTSRRLERLSRQAATAEVDPR